MAAICNYCWQLAVFFPLNLSLAFSWRTPWAVGRKEPPTWLCPCSHEWYMIRSSSKGSLCFRVYLFGRFPCRKTPAFRWPENSSDHRRPTLSRYSKLRQPVHSRTTELDCRYWIHESHSRKKKISLTFRKQKSADLLCNICIFHRKAPNQGSNTSNLGGFMVGHHPQIAQFFQNLLVRTMYRRSTKIFMPHNQNFLLPSLHLRQEVTHVSAIIWYFAHHPHSKTTEKKFVRKVLVRYGVDVQWLNISIARSIQRRDSRRGNLCFHWVDRPSSSSPWIATIINEEFHDIRVHNNRVLCVYSIIWLLYWNTQVELLNLLVSSKVTWLLVV